VSSSHVCTNSRRSGPDQRVGHEAQQRLDRHVELGHDGSGGGAEIEQGEAAPGPISGDRAGQKGGLGPDKVVAGPAFVMPQHGDKQAERCGGDRVGRPQQLGPRQPCADLARSASPGTDHASPPSFSRSHFGWCQLAHRRLTFPDVMPETVPGNMTVDMYTWIMKPASITR
jgi:hypothetical protein